MKRLLYHWITAKQTALHLILGTGFCAVFFLGKLISSSDPESTIPAICSKVGFYGLFLTLLGAVLHTGLHGCNHFLQYYKNTSQLPTRQLSLVCFFCMPLILSISAVLMLLSSALFAWFWKLLSTWFASRRVMVDPDAAASILPDVDLHTPQLTSVTEFSHTSLWASLLEQLLSVFGCILAAVFLLFVLYRLLLTVCQHISRASGPEDDLRICLKSEKNHSDLSEKIPHSGIHFKTFSIFRNTSDPRMEIRRIYKKKLLPQLKAKKSLSSCQWASPEELETISGISSEILHKTYEKARYCADPCTYDEVSSIINHKI